MKVSEIKIKKQGFEIDIEEDICFKCGLKFDDKERRRTNHHAIPKFLKPKMNIVIPICDKCHREMNNHYQPKLKLIKNQIKMYENGLIRGHEKGLIQLNKLKEKIDKWA